MSAKIVVSGTFMRILSSNLTLWAIRFLQISKVYTSVVLLTPKTRANKVFTTGKKRVLLGAETWFTHIKWASLVLRLSSYDTSWYLSRGLAWFKCSFDLNFNSTWPYLGKVAVESNLLKLNFLVSSCWTWNSWVELDGSKCWIWLTNATITCFVGAVNLNRNRRLRVRIRVGRFFGRKSTENQTMTRRRKTRSAAIQYISQL